MSQPPQMPQYGYSPPGYGPQPGYPPQPGYAPQFDYWSYYAQAPDALLAPARRAGWCLIGMGLVALLAGTCVGSVFGAIGEPQLAQMLAEVQKQQPANAAALSLTPQQLRPVMIAMGVVVGGIGLVAVALGTLVRGGRRGWLIAAMIACSLLMLYFAFAILTSLAGGVASLASAVVVLALPIGATGLAMTFLAQAMRNAGRINAARQQAAYAAYYASQQPPPN